MKNLTRPMSSTAQMVLSRRCKLQVVQHDDHTSPVMHKPCCDLIASGAAERFNAAALVAATRPEGCWIRSQSPAAVWRSSGAGCHLQSMPAQVTATKWLQKLVTTCGCLQLVACACCSPEHLLRPLVRNVRTQLNTASLCDQNHGGRLQQWQYAGGEGVNSAVLAFHCTLAYTNACLSASCACSCLPAGIAGAWSRP